MYSLHLMAGQTLNQALLSPSRVGDVNRSRVLQALCDHGPMSRAELAKLAGVTRATIGNIVQALIDANLVEEGEPQTGSGRVGKPGRPVWFGPRAGLCGAAAISAGTVEASLVNARGDVVGTAERSFDANDPDQRKVVGAVGDALRAVIDKRSADQLLGIGVAVPGVCDTATGSVIGSGQVPALQGTALVDALGRRFGRHVVLDNDSRAQALGEKWFGQGRGLANFVSVQTGHGLGVGVVLNGVLFRGARGETGELGHTCVVAQGGAKCRCGLRGCWETIATLRWLRAEAAARKLPNPSAVTASSLTALADDGSAKAAALLEAYADNLAVGLANLVMLLNPEKVILHGDVVGSGEPLRALIEDKTKTRVLPHLRDELRVALSSLDQEAGILGATGLVLSETFHLAT
jgi:predicted NBD/HSP70 family sugar kinase